MNLKRLYYAAAAAALILATAAGAAGFYLGTQRVEKTRVVEQGVFSVKTSEVLAATVQSLKAENKLIVYRFSGDARVKSTDVYGGFLTANQELIVPASTVYFIDMNEFGPENVRYDEGAKLVEITLPPLRIGDVSMRPEAATQINNGLMTLSSDVVQSLAKRNYAAARRAFVAQAQNPELVRLAREQAVNSITSQFQVPLRVVGMGDVRVSAQFR